LLSVEDPVGRRHQRPSEDRSRPPIERHDDRRAPLALIGLVAVNFDGPTFVFALNQSLSPLFSRPTEVVDLCGHQPDERHNDEPGQRLLTHVATDSVATGI